MEMPYVTLPPFQIRMPPMNQKTLWNRLSQLLGHASRQSDVSGADSRVRSQSILPFGSSSSRGSRQNTSLCARNLQMEELESRHLLSVTAADFSAIAAQYEELNLGQSADAWNVIEIDAAEFSTESLGQAIQEAVQTAEQTTANDLVVVRTTEDARTASFGDGSLVVNLDSDAYGSLAIVGWGDGMLRLVGTTQTVAGVQAGDVGFGGVTFFGLKKATSVPISTQDLLAEAKDASVTLSHSLMATGNGEGLGTAMESLATTSVGESTVTTLEHVSNTFYSLEFCVEDTTWAYVTGLSADDVINVEETLTGANGQLISGDFIDAEKDSSHSGESELCWAAAAANVLWYTGWANPYVAQDENGDSLFQSENDVFQFYVNSFTNAGNNAEYAFRWFINGEYPPQGAAGYSQMKEEGSGNFYPGQSFCDCGESLSMESKTNPAETLSNMGVFVEDLRNECGAVVSLGWYNSAGNRVGGHSVTAWGYLYDTAKEGNYDGYKALLITNSDDSMGTPTVNLLKTVALSWDSSMKRYEMVNFSTNTSYEGYIEEFICLTKYIPAIDLTFEKAGSLSQVNSLPGSPLTLNDLAVVNLGEEVSKEFTVEIYASLDDSLDTESAILLGSVESAGISDTETFSETGIALDTSRLVEGREYNIFVHITTILEEDTTNNTASAGTLKTIAGMFTSGAEAVLDSDEIVIGRKFCISDILVSNPLNTESGSYTLEFYAREDDNLSADELIATVSYASIAAGESVYVSSGDLSTAGMVANTNYVISWRLVDSNGDVLSTSGLSESIPAILTPFTAEEYEWILEHYPNLGLPAMDFEGELPSNLNFEVFEVNEESTVSLLNTAFLNALYYGGEGDKLLVIRVTEECHTLTLTGADRAIDFDFDASEGALTLAVIGPEGVRLTLDADSLNRVISVSRGDVRLGGFSFTGGVNANDKATACGAGVYNRDRLILDGCEVVGNQVSTNSNSVYTAGAGVFSSGTLSMFNCDVHGNSSKGGGAYGLGVYNDNGTLLMSGCRVYQQTQSSATGFLYGGGVYSLGTAAIEDSEFYGNTAQAGAAILNYGEMTVTGSSFHDNTAVVSGSSSSYGGAIYTQSELTVDRSQFYSNTATHGAAICSVDESVTPFVSNSLFYDNTATLYGGAFFTINLVANNNTLVDNAAKYGGAIFADRYESTSGYSGYDGGVLLLNNNLLVENQASVEGADVFNNYDLASVFGRNNIASFTAWSGGECTGGNMVYNPASALFVDAS